MFQKDEVNYIFLSSVTIMRISSKSMVVVLYRFGMGMSRWWYLSICDVCYMLFLMGTEGVCYLWCALSWGVQLKYVCSLLSYVGLQLLFVHICCLLLVDFWYGLSVLSILCICGDLFVQSVLCVRVLFFLLGGVVFSSLATGSQTCLVIVAWQCDILLLVIYP